MAPRSQVAGHWQTPGDWSRVLGRRLVVDVPASTANLGAGYDCLGLALDRLDRDAIAQVEREAEAVIARPEIGGRCGHVDDEPTAKDR